MKNSTIVLIASIILVFPFLIMIICACFADEDFDNTVLGRLVNNQK